jgi:hypothetical protein
MDLISIEKELKKRTTYPYKWGRKQSNEWDRLTNFIYKINDFDSLLSKIHNFDNGLKNYALNRWYNFLSAKAVEYMFAQHPIVKPNLNQYDKLVDFSINEIDFDHKTSVFPKGYEKGLEFAQNNKSDMINWLYENQSQQGRKHFKNRLFVILYDSNEHQHWKMKSELMLLKGVIDNYVNGFSSKKLSELNFGRGIILSDIIWVIK